MELIATYDHDSKMLDMASWKIEEIGEFIGEPEMDMDMVKQGQEDELPRESKEIER